MLRCMIVQNIREWEELLPHTYLTYNRVVHWTTSHSPFKVVYGLNPLTPLDLLPLRTHEAWTYQDGEAKAKYIQDLHLQVKETIERRVKKQQEDGNKGRKEVLFQERDWVWLHLRKDRFPTQRKSNLLPRGDGPFQVIRRINNNAYELDLPLSYNISNSFNGCDLSPFDVGFKNLWSNSLQEREDDEGVTHHTTSLEAPSGRITRRMSRGESSIRSSLSFFCITLVWIP